MNRLDRSFPLVDRVANIEALMIVSNARCGLIDDEADLDLAEARRAGKAGA